MQREERLGAERGRETVGGHTLKSLPEKLIQHRNCGALFPKTRKYSVI